MTLITAKIIGDHAVLAYDSGVYSDNILIRDHAPKAWSYGWLAAGVSGYTVQADFIREKFNELVTRKTEKEILDDWSFVGLTKLAKFLRQAITDELGFDKEDISAEIILCSAKGIAIVSVKSLVVQVLMKYCAVGCDADFSEGYMANGGTPLDALNFAVDQRLNTACQRPFNVFRVPLTKQSQVLEPVTLDNSFSATDSEDNGHLAERALEALTA